MTSTTPLAERAVEEFFDGRQFGTQRPSEAIDTFRIVATEVLTEFADAYWPQADMIAQMSDDEVGRRLQTAIRERWGFHGHNPYAITEVDKEQCEATGRWVKDFFQREKTDGAPDWKVYLGDYWNVTGPAIANWMLNDTYDIAPTVDEQINVINRAATSPNETVSGADPGVKDYVGAAMKYKTRRLLPVGTEFTLKDAGEGDQSLDGIYVNDSFRREATYTVAGFDETRRPPALAVEVGPNPHGMAYVLAHHVVPISPGKTDDVEVKDEPVDEEKETLRRERDTYRRLVAELRTEGNAICEAIRDEAIAREWCSEYETFVNGLTLQHFEFQPREQEYEVAMTFTATTTGSYTTTVTARDEDEAAEKAEEILNNLDSSDVYDHTSDYPNICVDDFDVTEA